MYIKVIFLQTANDIVVEERFIIKEEIQNMCKYAQHIANRLECSIEVRFIEQYSFTYNPKKKKSV